MLTVLVLVSELQKQLYCSGLEDLLVALEIVKAKSGPVGHLVESIILLVETQRVVVILLNFEAASLSRNMTREIALAW